MHKLILFTLVSLAAQLVDGPLGMGYGMTPSSLLLLAGLSPALVLVSVHLAEIGTTLASGASHWKLDNIDPRLMARLGLPGVVGAPSGATVLSHLSTHAAIPVTTSLLTLLGIYVLECFALRPSRGSGSQRSPYGGRLLVPLGMMGGFADAIGGGGWGPMVTMMLLTGGRMVPCIVAGSVGVSEFLVTVAVSTGFLTGLGTADISPGIVLTLLAGGLVATPVSAQLAFRLPGAVLGITVGGLILVMNPRILLSRVETSTRTGAVSYGMLGVIWAAFLALVVCKARAAVTEIREETEQVLGKVRSDPQHDHAPEATVPDESLAAGDPVGSRPVEPAHPRKRSVLVVELV